MHFTRIYIQYTRNLTLIQCAGRLAIIRVIETANENEKQNWSPPYSFHSYMCVY